MQHGGKSTQSLAKLISIIRAPSENAGMYFETIYPVTLENLLHWTNLNAFSTIIFKHGIHGNQDFS